MNGHDLQQLKAIQGYPCITITLPSHRASPENQQDPIRVKNLVTEATNRLLGEMSRREAEPLLTRLDDLVNDIDYPHLLDGLALFVSADVARWHTVPHTLPERVVVDETFLIRDIVRAMNRLRRYWVLVLSEKPTRLFAASRDSLEEMTDREFPMVHTGPGGEAPLPGGFGIRRSAHRDERHRQFFRAVDEAFKTYVAEDPLPLIVVGVERHLSFFGEVSTITNDIIATITGNHDSATPHELGQLVWPVAREQFVTRRLEVLDRLETAVGAQRSSSTLGEVWRAARVGRGDTLVVEDSYHQPARINEMGLLDLDVDDPTAPDVLDDAVDEVITMVLQKDGDVVFVEDGELEQHGRIALILRY
ncbi:MAG TPA: hypothetical protein PKA95_04375 [Thermomicrobiales bacterium]|nr:hypothetical protein [Thermomicrobiales bacterium]